jgi:hypothetical protein
MLPLLHVSFQRATPATAEARERRGQVLGGGPRGGGLKKILKGHGGSGRLHNINSQKSGYSDFMENVYSYIHIHIYIYIYIYCVFLCVCVRVCLSVCRSVCVCVCVCVWYATTVAVGHSCDC